MDVVKYPGAPLRKGGRKVTSFDADLRDLAERMLDTMYTARGVGLAAPQVGIDLELLVLNETGERDDRDHEMVLVNPEIVANKGREFGEEGCLSFPGLYAEVERSVKLTVKYQDLDGAAQELRCSGFLARIIQHEIDHLKGVLFVDRLSSVEKMRVRGQLQDMERRFEAAKA